MNSATYNIPIELNTLGDYTIRELKEKLMAYAMTLVSVTPKEEAKLRKIQVSDRIKALSAVPSEPVDKDYKEDFREILADKY